MRARGATGVANVVAFEVGAVLYALYIQRVRGIVKPLPVQRLAHLPGEVVGVADYRGEVLPVVDLRLRFGLPAQAGADGRWIVAQCGARLLAFVVDRVIEVCDTRRLPAREPPNIEHGAEVRGIVAAHLYGQGLLFVVDVDVLGAAAHALDPQRLQLPGFAAMEEHGQR